MAAGNASVPEIVGGITLKGGGKDIGEPPSGDEASYAPETPSEGLTGKYVTIKDEDGKLD